MSSPSFQKVNVPFFLRERRKTSRTAGGWQQKLKFLYTSLHCFFFVVVKSLNKLQKLSAMSKKTFWLWVRYQICPPSRKKVFARFTLVKPSNKSFWTKKFGGGKRQKVSKWGLHPQAHPGLKSLFGLAAVRGSLHFSNPTWADCICQNRPLLLLLYFSVAFYGLQDRLGAGEKRLWDQPSLVAQKKKERRRKLHLSKPFSSSVFDLAPKLQDLRWWSFLSSILTQ